MINRRQLLFLVFVLVATVAINLYRIKSKQEKVSVQTPTTSASVEKSLPLPVKDVQKLQIDGKKVIGLRPGKEKEEFDHLKIANAPTGEWEEGLEKTIRAQGGESLKEVILKKESSMVWTQDGIALYVETVNVTLKNDKNGVTNFRVLVDSQSGKILKNWDHPVIDPINPRENFTFKVDPRHYPD